MLITVTGDTKGIGHSLALQLTSMGHQVVGFSRTKGFDIGHKATRDKILPTIKRSDIFINNAYHETGQTELLKEILNAWTGTTKTLVHIGSSCANISEQKFLDIFGNTVYNQLYIKEKKLQLDTINKHLESNTRQRVLHIMPAMVDTEMIAPEFRSTNIMSPDDVAEVICNTIFSQRNNLYIQQLTFTSIL
jgi:NADP-dependent 3-hydroxy acid dehydrogenase YdfG